MRYVQLQANSHLPDLGLSQPFKALLVLDAVATADERRAICDGLVAAGCRYLMAWGVDCELWNSAVQLASHMPFGDEPLPDRNVVISTTHGTENLLDTVWFAKYSAMHPCYQLNELVVLHWGKADREAEIATLWGAS